ncbi:MAG: restriction endonuclease subunit S [Paludibacteraceae bacterium]|nr:restriction endonuclease subunit S [Paludibacteraceae bacterium]
MKDSGIPWIGEIPEGWGKDKIIRVFRTIGSGTTPKSTEESNFGGDINWIQSGDINGGVMSSCKNQVSEETLLNCPALKVYKFPFIIVAMYGASVGNTSISTIDGCVNQACCVLGDSVLNFKYAFSTIKSCKDYWLIKAIGGGQPNISQETIRQTWIPVPPLAEQHLIATFLDKKCSEIDSLIDLQEQMIEELKAYKQSVITEAVTKGLNPNVPMKDSGIEWIGDVPEEWEVCRIKNVASLFGRIGFRGYTSDDLNKDGEGAITLSPSNMLPMGMDYTNVTYLSWMKYHESPEIMIQNGDILMVKTGSSYGKVSYVDNLPKEATINPQILRIVAKINSKYLGYYLQTPLFIYQVEGGVVGGTIPTISQEKINNFFVVIPPLAEQQAIADYLDKKCGEIDELITIKQQKIESLKEYKKSVIYEYVTGKREV